MNETASIKFIDIFYQIFTWKTLCSDKFFDDTISLHS